MVLKNIKEIKNIEKKIIHRKISSSRYVRMIRFFYFYQSQFQGYA